MIIRRKANGSTKFFIGPILGGALGGFVSVVDNMLGVPDTSSTPIAGMVFGAAVGTYLARTFHNGTDATSSRGKDESNDMGILQDEQAGPVASSVIPVSEQKGGKNRNVSESDVLVEIENAVTKLSLARSYVELGDMELASSIFMEAMQDQKVIGEDILALNRIQQHNR